MSPVECVYFVVDTLNEPARRILKKRKLQEVVIYSDSDDEWAKHLQSIILLEHSAFSVLRLNVQFSTFMTRFPFLCGTSLKDAFPDSVPSMVVENFLFLGNRRQASDAAIMRTHLQITHVIDLHDEDRDPQEPFSEYGVNYLNIRLWDRSESNLGEHFPAVFAFIENARRAAGARVLVHCNHGISRSATCAVYYVMRRNACALPDALRAVKRAREIIHPNQGFLRQLEDAEDRPWRPCVVQ